MLKLLIVAAFIWLLFKAIGLAFKLTWGLAKLAAGILMFFALPALIVCVLFFSGIVLLIPIVLLGIAIFILKACI